MLALHFWDSWQQTPASNRTQRVQAAWRIAAVVVGVPLILIGMSSSPLNPQNPPSDAKLLADFPRHEATLNEIAQMAQAEEGLIWVLRNETNPTDPHTVGVSPARIARYHQLLNAAGVPEGFTQNSDNGGIYFENWRYGPATSTHSDKGYVYLTPPPAHTLSSLDECGFEVNGIVAYRHIEGNWYLYYDYTP